MIAEGRKLFEQFLRKVNKLGGAAAIAGAGATRRRTPRAICELSRDEARRIAANIAKLPELVTKADGT